MMLEFRDFSSSGIRSRVDRHLESASPIFCHGHRDQEKRLIEHEEQELTTLKWQIYICFT